ncbi:BTAD domain-containing putative transcriptional regulator [Streptomyces sp. NPDC006514]|uniref:AfsR/SARP family transcriptional regulator n=1 Tax=Streptomyces sp. NPDC006514 TaxID=3154308 RepID=UPI0033A2D4E7
MNFRVLGIVSADGDGRAVALDGSKQRTVLAALLLAQGSLVTDERLTTLLWGYEPPSTSTKQLYTYVSRLRTRLGDAVRLERNGRGYLLDIGGAFFDWAVFRRLVETGGNDMRAGRYTEAERRFAGALVLWNGPVLTGVTERFVEAEGPRLAEARLVALEGHAEAALAMGGHAEVVPSLMREVAQHPLHERLRGQLMTALYHCGRQADALAVYESGCHILAEDLGIDPGPALRTLRQQILTNALPPPAVGGPAIRMATPRADTQVTSVPEPPFGSAVVRPPAAEWKAETSWAAEAPPWFAAGAVLAAEVSSVPLAVGPGPRAEGDAPAAAGEARDGVWQTAVPAEVPAAPGDFTGRLREVEEVVAALRGQRDVVITGAPGTGKSVLAHHVAERCHDTFRDGRLYADLGSARDPHEVLGWFLRALGTAPSDLPATFDERVQLYRTRSAGRRLLVVLDGARDDSQVRPLLPGAGASRTVVTGVPASLGSLEGTRLVRLGPLAPGDAVRLLAAVAGPERIAAEPEAALRIAELCDRVPLALRIAAVRLAARPQWSVAHLATRLEPEEHRLAELRFGSLDAGAGIRAVLRGLPEELLKAFTVLAAAGPDGITAVDAAVVLDTAVEDAEEVLGQLTDMRLLEGRTADGSRWPHYRVAPLARLVAGGLGTPELSVA